jgi:UDP-N-acetylmuramate dehydrogenase
MTRSAPTSIDAAAALAGVTVHADEPLAPRTTWKIGGPARWLVEVAEVASLAPLLAHLAGTGIPWAVLGNGSNVLVSDRGFDGAVIVLEGELASLVLVRDVVPQSARPHRLVAGGGASLTRLLRMAKDERLSDLWVLGGVPGRVGGAVKMNAGTRWGDVSQSLVEVQLARATGLETVPAAALGLAYRHSNVHADTIIARATFAVGDADEVTRDKLDEVLAYRKATQPLQFPSCGSVFANPPGDSAGRLIEAAGLKGFRIGAMQVADQHANWILNTGGGTAADALRLIAHLQAEVKARFGVELRPEVQRFGDFAEVDA